MDDGSACMMDYDGDFFGSDGGNNSPIPLPSVVLAIQTVMTRQMLSI